MGWQDRDYAQRQGPPQTYGGMGGFAPRGGRSLVTTLIIINVVVYFLGSLTPTMDKFIYTYGAMQAEAVMSGQVWRLITAQYLHGGIGHLLLNMIGLHFLGRPLERMWSPRKFFTIYTLCGLFGYVFYTILGASGVGDLAWRPAVGASGSIFGLLGIVAVLFPTATVYIYFLFPMRIRTAAYIFAGIALLTVLQQGGNYGGEACHLAGLIFGVWWAWKGDAWWRQTEMRMPKFRAQTRRHKSGGFRDTVAQRREDAETVDRILKKVYDGGIHSLSESERSALQQATERQKQREARAGRIDRL